MKLTRPLQCENNYNAHATLITPLVYALLANVYVSSRTLCRRLLLSTVVFLVDDESAQTAAALLQGCGVSTASSSEKSGKPDVSTSCGALDGGDFLLPSRRRGDG